MLRKHFAVRRFTRRGNDGVRDVAVTSFAKREDAVEWAAVANDWLMERELYNPRICDCDTCTTGPFQNPPSPPFDPEWVPVFGGAYLADSHARHVVLEPGAHKILRINRQIDGRDKSSWDMYYWRCSCGAKGRPQHHRSFAHQAGKLHVERAARAERLFAYSLSEEHVKQ